jgi:predicted ATP-binding protein involved in virulence
LDAFALTISDFLKGFQQTLKPTDLRPVSPDDIRYVTISMGQNPIRERSNNWMSLIFEGYINNLPSRWFVLDPFVMRSISAVTLIATDIALDLNKNITKPDTILPILAQYGTGRLWKKSNDENVETLSPESRLIGYQDCLNPDLERLFRWFKTQELAALQKKEPRHVLEAVRLAIVAMIPDTENIWWDVDWDELLIRTNINGKAQTTPFHLLSDGYRNMIGMAADIAYRMAKLNPQLEADVIKQTQGIVLIDEIDLHLHPKWQRQVVGRLLDTFPKVQFVASSHSPFIIQSLYHRDDVLLWDLETAKPLTIDSKSIEDIAENQQGVEIPQQSQRFLDMEKAAEKYYTLLKQMPSASEEEKTRLKQHLDELLFPYSDDPAFQAFLKMECFAVENNNGA